jgi:hypothetical protein
MAALTAHAVPLNCEDSPTKVVLARVVTTQARLNFVAGLDKAACAGRPMAPCIELRLTRLLDDIRGQAHHDAQQGWCSEPRCPSSRLHVQRDEGSRWPAFGREAVQPPVPHWEPELAPTFANIEDGKLSCWPKMEGAIAPRRLISRLLELGYNIGHWRFDGLLY